MTVPLVFLEGGKWLFIADRVYHLSAVAPCSGVPGHLKLGSLGHLSGEWPVNRCAAERGVSAIERVSQVVVKDARPDL